MLAQVVQRVGLTAALRACSTDARVRPGDRLGVVLDRRFQRLLYYKNGRRLALWSGGCEGWRGWGRPLPRNTPLAPCIEVHARRPMRVTLRAWRAPSPMDWCVSASQSSS